MICTECLDRIADLERLERLYTEKQNAFRNNKTTPKNHREDSALWIAARDAKLDMVIARLELKRHQRHHAAQKRAVA